VEFARGRKHGAFQQLITIPLCRNHRVLAQVAGHASHTVKLLPALVISEQDCDWIENSFDEVIADNHRVPGGVWSLGMTLARNARKTYDMSAVND
jgi:ornithine--oxo-acid transaminase